MGFELVGVDPSPDAASLARQRGLDVHTGTIDQVELPTRSFDFVRFWHVLEHVPDPLRALRAARERLRDDGMIIIGVPNFASLPARLARARWYALDLPRRLYHFEPRTISRLCAAAGLGVETMHHVSAGGLAGTLDNVFAGRREFTTKLVDRPLVVTALAPIEAGLDLLRLGEGLDVRARKAE